METTSEVADSSWLAPEELPAVASAVAGRRRDFALGRRCARLAASELGISAGPIRRGEGGAPQWPYGLVGSITHTEGYAAAAVARSSEVVALGLDAEPNEPLPEGAARLIVRPEERERMAAVRDSGGVHLDRLVFCAKEATYKVWFPLARRWLDFSDATVHIEPADQASGSFRVEILSEGPVKTVTGRYLVDGRHLLAAIEIGPKRQTPPTEADGV